VNLVWSKRALADLARNENHIAPLNPIAAFAVTARIETAARLLELFP
jgi:plasmid stabilization system protein ParE